MKSTNVAGFLVAFSFFMGLVEAGALSSSLSQLANETKGRDSDISSITLKSATLFARKDVGGAASTYTFLDNTTEKKYGVCNIDKGRLPLNEAFVFNEISVGFKLGANDIPGGVAYDAALPVGLRNGEIQIVQGGRIVYEGTMAELNNPYTGVREEDQWTKLNSLCYIADNEDFRILIHLPAGQTVTAGSGGANHPYLEVRLRGHKTAKRTV